MVENLSQAASAINSHFPLSQMLYWSQQTEHPWSWGLFLVALERMYHTNSHWCWVVFFLPLNPFQNGIDLVSMQYQQNRFVAIFFLQYSRSWNIHWSFPRIWLPSTFPYLHEYRKQLFYCHCSRSFIGASSCLWSFPFFILSAACAAVEYNGGGSVLHA